MKSSSNPVVVNGERGEKEKRKSLEKTFKRGSERSVLYSVILHGSIVLDQIDPEF